MTYPEIIKPVPGFPDYWASNAGRIFSMKRGRCTELKPYDSVNRSGPHLIVQMYKSGPIGKRKRKTKTVHSIVADTFELSKPPGAYMIRHWNGNYRDCSLHNLVYGTAKDNSNDTKRYNEEIDTSWI